MNKSRRITADDQPRRPILIGQAEEIPNPNIRPEVHAMLANEGLWIGGDKKHPNTMVLFWSSGGEIWSMKLDAKMDPERFLDTATFRGPFTPDAKDDPVNTRHAPQPAPAGVSDTERPSDERILNWIAMRWDSQKLGRQALAFVLENETGSLRDACAAAMRGEKEGL